MAIKIYTRTGDEGNTALFGGKRLPKSHVRIEAYGTIDELNAFTGLLRDHLEDRPVRDRLFEVQNRLFDLGSYLASDPEKQLIELTLRETDIRDLEGDIDEMEQSLPPLKNFILPGGHPILSYCHLARCVCRRAERQVVALHLHEEVNPLALQYLNRLSDYFFVLGRKLARDLDIQEVLWKSRS